MASRNLEQDFFESLDRHTPRFLEIFRSKKGVVGAALSQILGQVEHRVSILPPPTHYHCYSFSYTVTRSRSQIAHSLYSTR